MTKSAEEIAELTNSAGRDVNAHWGSYAKTESWARERDRLQAKWRALRNKWENAMVSASG